MKRDLDAACERLPFFPLPNVVLFPGMQLPLHIFEPRYRQMIADALEGHRAIAMALPVGTPGSADSGTAKPRIHEVAGLGWIVGHERLPDGRSHILLEGGARVRLHELPQERLYRIARAERLVERAPESVPTQSIVSLAMQIATIARRHDPHFQLRLPSGASPGVLCDHLASRLIQDPFVRQRVLEAVDVGLRIDVLGSALADVLQELARASGSGAPPS